ncbi:hypothetical protein MLD38_016583 [Melastoma candidum]|uniref:Uncharacterized protein n=1 Tax=Melastoma candidum TaxID=119954 RepID=A0ACB9QM89_9MYRT|nr:hypothetical protein MLD38_016583 [Melastoma candidum]
MNGACRSPSVRLASLIAGGARRAFFSTSSRIPQHGAIQSRSSGSGMLGIQNGGSWSVKSFSAPCFLGFKRLEHSSAPEDESRTSNTTVDFVRRIIQEDGNRTRGGFSSSRRNADVDIDIVHFKLMKNNTFVTVTDSKGNKKIGASAGCLPEMRGGPKMSRYAAEATAEHVGKMSRSLGLKSVVMRVNGFTHFSKKKQAIMSWREGFMNSQGDHPIISLEDTTRLPHNGCRLPKKRRI